MIYQKLMNIMKLQAQLSNNANYYTAVGQITAYNPSDYTAVVQLQPADADENAQLTGWLPVGSIWIGNSWGLFTPPNIGDICEVYFQEGDINNGYIGLRYYNNITSIPLSVPSGEFWLVHQTGSFIKLTTNGNMSLNSTTEIDINAPVINIGATGGTFETLLNSLALTVYNGHTHDISGGGVTLVPNQLMSSSDVTTNLKGS